MVVGQLGPVSNLQVANADTGSILITWTAPFSLDITNTDPDIWYSVTITTAGDGDKHCDNLTDTLYNFTINEIPNGMYQFEVTSVNSILSASTPEILNIFITTAYNENFKVHNLTESPVHNLTEFPTLLHNTGTG